MHFNERSETKTKTTLGFFVFILFRYIVLIHVINELINTFYFMK